MAVTTIKATCHECGDVVLGVVDIELHDCDTATAAWYSFSCPVCERTVARHAAPAVIASLASAGCRVAPWGCAAPTGRARSGPAITERDVADFVTALDADGSSSAMRAELLCRGPDEGAR